MDAPAGLKEAQRLVRQWTLLAENLHQLVPLAADAVLGVRFVCFSLGGSAGAAVHQLVPLAADVVLWGSRDRRGRSWRRGSECGRGRGGYGRGDGGGG